MSGRNLLIGSAVLGDECDAETSITLATVDGPRMRTLLLTRTPGNAMYLAFAESGKRVYTAHGLPVGIVSAWNWAESGLTPLGQPQATGGGLACHLSLSPRDRFVVCASYEPGSVTVHPVLPDGRLQSHVDLVRPAGGGPHPRQDGSHPHMVVMDAARGHVLVTDLGTDSVHRFALNGQGELDPVDHVVLAKGSGPRHLVLHAGLAYVLGELDSTLTVVDLDASPPVVVGAVPIGTGGAADARPSALVMSADERLVYVASRGPDTISTYSVSRSDVRLVGVVPSGGMHPWDLAVIDDFLYVANQRSSEVSALPLVHGIPGRSAASLEVPHPVAVAPVPW